MYSVIVEKGEYVLLENQNEYVVAYGYNPKAEEGKQWEDAEYFPHWNQKSRKMDMLSIALEYLRIKTEKGYIPYARLVEIAEILKEGILSDDEESAEEYFSRKEIVDDLKKIENL